VNRGKKVQFSRVLWGFKPAQVRLEMERMADSHENKLLHYQQEVEKIQVELERLIDQQTACQEQIAQYQRRENLLAATLLTAQAEADQMLSEARQEGDALINGAHEETERQRSLLLAVEQQQELFMKEFGTLYQRLQNNCLLLLNPVANDSNEAESSTQPAESSITVSNRESGGEGGEVH